MFREKNILILSQSGIIAGAELTLKNFIDADNDYNFIILTDEKIKILYQESKNVYAIYTSDFFKRFSYKKAGDITGIFSFVYSIIRNLIILNTIVKKHQIRIIYGNNSYDSVLVSLYKILNPNIKTIQHIHDNLPEKSFLARWIKLFQSRYDHIIVPSTHTLRHFKSMLKNNVIISVVHNGIDVSKKNDKQVREIYDELKIDKNKKIIATICRIDSNKRVDIFIDALNELSKSRNDLTGIIVGESGDPDLLKSLQVNAAKSKVPIHFTGFMSHESILNLYNLIDLLMINSDSETFSMVTLEAMSKKCLVLARQVGGVNDIITDNNNGFFYDYSADIKTIAEKIDYVLNLNNNDRNQIKKNALEIIEKNFQQKNKVEKVNKIFSDLLGS